MLKIKILLLLVLSNFVIFAQPDDKRDHKEMREKIHAEKVAFIATQLDLTTEEAQKFWPVYNAYDSEIDAVRKERHDYLRELKKSEELSPERSYQLFELIFATEKTESGIRLKYLAKFSTVLGKKKAAGVFIAEERFKRELMKKFKRYHQPTPPPSGE